MAEPESWRPIHMFTEQTQTHESVDELVDTKPGKSINMANAPNNNSATTKSGSNNFTSAEPSTYAAVDETSINSVSASTTTPLSLLTPTNPHPHTTAAPCVFPLTDLLLSTGNRRFTLRVPATWDRHTVAIRGLALTIRRGTDDAGDWQTRRFVPPFPLRAGKQRVDLASPLPPPPLLSSRGLVVSRVWTNDRSPMDPPHLRRYALALDVTQSAPTALRWALAALIGGLSLADVRMDLSEAVVEVSAEGWLVEPPTPLSPAEMAARNRKRRRFLAFGGVAEAGAGGGSCDSESDVREWTVWWKVMDA
ncbi:MAG: hypothetical protein M1822_007807 [Bathelium mastoideum]|nr:MAG: hypothetical protein M1822_007807 [Bathelium mastoideum]